MHKVGIYCRLSKDDAEVGESRSIKNQREMLISYAERNELNIVDTYIDDGISGMEFNRPEFQRMLADAQTGKIDTILCKDISRFSRDDVVVKQYLHEKFFLWGIRFIALDGTDNLDQNFLDNSAFRSFFNEFYVRDTSRKIKAVLDSKRKSGQYCRCAPYGYIKDPMDKYHLIPDENTAPIVQRIFDEYVGGKAVRYIAEELNDDGIPSPAQYKKTIYPNYSNRVQDGKWTVNSLRGILSSEVYIGNTVLGRREKVSYRTKKVVYTPKESWVRTENTHEPIVDKAIWRQAQGKYADPTVRANKYTHHTHPLSGKVKCAVCGGTMTRRTIKIREHQYIYYSCTTAYSGNGNCNNTATFKGEQIESIVLNEINNAVKKYTDPKELEVPKTNMDKYTKQLSQNRTKQEQTKNRISGLITFLVDGTLTREQFTSQQDIYNNELQQLQQQEQEIQDKIDELSDTTRLQQIIQQYSTGNIEELTTSLVNDLIDRITVGRLHNGIIVNVDMKI